MKTLLLFFLLAISARGALTTVAETLVNADGTNPNGPCVISWPYFTSVTGAGVAANRKTITVTAGVVSVALEPNDHTSTVYTVVCTWSTGRVVTEYWRVPTATPVTVVAVRLAVPPQPSITVTKGQLPATVAYEDEANIFTAAGGVTLADQLELRLREAVANGTNSIGLRAPPLLGATGIITLAELAAGYWKMDGSGNVTWAYPPFSEITGIATPVQLSQTVNKQTGTTYAFTNADRGSLVTQTNASPIADTLPQAGASSLFIAGWFVDVQNRGAGTVTITPTTSTIDGAATLALTTGEGTRIVSDGTNYFTQRGMGSSTGAVPTSRLLTCATGLTGCGDLSADRTLALDFNALSTKGTAADGDLFSLYDPSAGGHRKMARSTLLSGLGGTLIFQGVWNASTNTPTLADGTGTTNHYYITSVAGTQNLGSGSQTFAVGDLVIHNGTAWKLVGTAGLGVTSFNSRLNAVVPVSGDYTAAMITNTPAGSIGADDVQDAINELDTDKAAASHTHAAGDITSGTLAMARLASGTPDGTKFVRDDGTLAVPAGTSGTATSHGSIYVSTTAGTPITATVYAKLAGTTTAQSLADFTMTASNRLRYDGAGTIVFKFVVAAAIRGTSNNLVTSIRLAKNGTDDATTRQSVNLASANRAQAIGTSGVVSLATNDYIEVWATAASNTTLTVDTMVVNVFATGGASGANEFTDNLFRVIDNGDNTKQLAFQVSGVTTGNVRTMTVPNFDGTLATLAGVETLTNKSISGGQITSVVATATALAANGANCSGNNFALGVDASGVGECAQPAFTNLSGAATTAQLPAPARVHSLQASFGKCGGTAPTAGEFIYQPEVPFACTISAWTISGDTGTTATFKVWRAADGTAVPTSGGSINTSGISLSSNTRVRSTTVTDFTDTTLDIHDVTAIELTAFAGGTCVQVFIQCDI